ncbi:hypothetical protein GINT2_001489 [Glugoides intestinalis]
MLLEKTKQISKQDIIRTVQLIIEGISPYIQTRLLKYAKTKSMSSRKNNFIMLREESMLKGFLMYRIEKNCCILYEIHVSEEKRSQGHGTSLIKELLKDQIGKMIILFVHTKNLKAQQFYAANGFTFKENSENSSYYEMHKQN